MGAAATTSRSGQCRAALARVGWVGEMRARPLRSPTTCRDRGPDGASPVLAGAFRIRGRRAPSTLALTIGGGGEGIRTPGSLARTAVFKTAAIDHSATPPGATAEYLATAGA